MTETLYAPWQGRMVADSYQFAVSAAPRQQASKTLQDHRVYGAFAMGDPDTFIEVPKQYREAGIDSILRFRQLGNQARAYHGLD
jgi:hypothetical protein